MKDKDGEGGGISEEDENKESALQPNKYNRSELTCPCK